PRSPAQGRRPRLSAAARRLQGVRREPGAEEEGVRASVAAARLFTSGDSVVCWGDNSRSPIPERTAAMSPVADRNLLFGLLALQMDLVTREQLIAGFQDWMLQKDTPVAEVLRQRGALQTEDVEAVEVLVRRRLARHGDVPRSLAGLRVEEPVVR